MVFKDLLINIKRSSKERLTYLKQHLDKLGEGEKVVFLGKTFEENDLNLSFMIGLIKFLNRYTSSTFYIQDESGKDDSWYQIADWPDHVNIFVKESEVEMIFDDFSEILTYKEVVSQGQSVKTGALLHPVDIQLIKKIEQIHFEHKDDIVGAFINEIKNKELDPYVEASMIKIGLDALLRR